MDTHGHFDAGIHGAVDGPGREDVKQACASTFEARCGLLAPFYSLSPTFAENGTKSSVVGLHTFQIGHDPFFFLVKICEVTRAVHGSYKFKRQ